MTGELKVAETQNSLLRRDTIKEGQKLDEIFLSFIETTCEDELPMESLKAVVSFLNKRLELVKSHGGNPSSEPSREQLLLEGFLSNPHLSRSSLISYIKSTYRELQEMNSRRESTIDCRYE